MPLQSSVVGALHPASPDASGAPPASVGTTMMPCGAASREASTPPFAPGAEGENTDPHAHKANAPATKTKDTAEERCATISEDDYYDDPR